ncbi:hypothetical protein FY534_02855 [Alicyclobacillus sp. TC]|uniref:hypothetical protein n=1 Tax=Alicyclobacillus sp. TC TaxID=2606450 RepID=UPI001932B48A|nr:hypothetical protein [Alicyclobacillus sp. TC]QRF22736.1 hypothetical protein FY534_02855 [Alicyclobacillus sp. TC]
MKKSWLYYLGLSTMSAMVPIGISGTYALFTHQTQSSPVSFGTGTVQVELKQDTNHSLLIEPYDSTDYSAFLNNHFQPHRDILYMVTNTGTVNEWVRLDSAATLYLGGNPNAAHELAGSYKILTLPSTNDEKDLVQSLIEDLQNQQWTVGSTETSLANLDISSFAPRCQQWLLQLPTMIQNQSHLTGCLAYMTNGQWSPEQQQILQNYCQQFFSSLQSEGYHTVADIPEVAWQSFFQSLFSQLNASKLKQEVVAGGNDPSCTVLASGSLLFSQIFSLGNTNWNQLQQSIPLSLPNAVDSVAGSAAYSNTTWFPLAPGQTAVVVYQLYVQDTSPLGEAGCKNSSPFVPNTSSNTLMTWAYVVQHENVSQISN